VNFLLDHDVPDEADQLLRFWKHDTRRLRDVLPVTTPDEAVFTWAQRESRIIITCNQRHFLALARKAVERSESFPGLIVLIRRRTRQSECGHLLTLIRRAGDSGLKGNINLA
jgi:hypothetical protein